jgi:two-component system, OmpR family, phosphate regulon sensor histidine kinase PhoR
MVVEANSMDSHDELRVLLVEDDEDDYILISTLLSESAFGRIKVDWARSYDAGLDALSRIRYDACLLDYALGPQSGLVLLSEARRKGASAAVILLTARTGKGTELEALAAGASDYLVKGEISASSLERSIRYAVEIKKAELELRRHRDHLEDLVKQRTSELRQANLSLSTQIEERMEVEQALRRNEEMFRSLVINSLDIIFTIATDGVITSLNPAFEKVTGWKPEEWVGRNYGLLVHPDDLPILEERRQKVLMGEEFPPGEVRVFVKPGGFRLLEFQSTPLYAGNCIVGQIGTARDITDRKKAEERILQQHAFLKTVLESIAHPFYVVDAKDYSVVLANAAAASRELPSNTKCHTLFHRSDKPCEGEEHKCPLKEIKRSRKPLTTEHIHYDHLGRPRYVEVHGHPILDENGEVSKIIEYCLDITARKEIEQKLVTANDDLEIRVQKRTEELADVNLALMNEVVERRRIEEALRLNEKRLEALLDLSQIPWASEREIADYVLDQEIMLTRSETGAIGFLDKEEKVLTWATGVHDSSECSCIQTWEAGTWADAVKHRKPVVVNESSNSDEDRKGLPFSHIRLRRFMSIPVFDGQRITAVAVVANKSDDFDQSDLRQLSLLMDGMWKLIQRERSIKALKDSENLAAIGRALSGVAHDMKTPLIAIGGFVKQVQRHFAKTHPDWGKMGIVLSETERLEKMVEDMLDFSKPLQLRKAPAEISAVLEESVAVIKALADVKRVKLRVESLGSAPPVLLDCSRIKQVFINLLTNAIEASPKGRTVKICYRMLGKDLVVDVTDKGPGIAIEIRKEIFLPFFTTRKEGTGLGLPIVKKIIEAHNGSLEVLDTFIGATFRLRLPI